MSGQKRGKWKPTAEEREKVLKTWEWIRAHVQAAYSILESIDEPSHEKIAKVWDDLRHHVAAPVEIMDETYDLVHGPILVKSKLKFDPKTFGQEMEKLLGGTKPEQPKELKAVVYLGETEDQSPRKVHVKVDEKPKKRRPR